LSDCFQEVISCIQDKAAALTRRSAGLPALVTGILAAQTMCKDFSKVINDLQNIANEPVEVLSDNQDIRLPQVHALNCLKDIFSSTRLGPATEAHVEQTLLIAISSLDKDV
jgi:hypothetical protein